MKSFKNLQEVLSFYNVVCHEPYYISSGNPILKFPDIPFRMDYYAFCICISGELQIEIDHTRYTVKTNDILISAPTTVVRFLGNSNDFRMRLLFFEKNFLLKNISDPFIVEKMQLFRQGSYTILSVDKKTATSLLDLLHYLKEKSKLKGRYTSDILRTITFNILLELAEFLDIHRPKSNIETASKELVYKYLQLLRNNIREHKDVSHYAQELYVSNKYLIETVKKATGKTPHQLIDEALLKEAYVMLGNPELTISEIAYALQFNSISAFGRFFKKHAHMAPSDFRKKEHLI